MIANSNNQKTKEEINLIKPRCHICNQQAIFSIRLAHQSDFVAFYLCELHFNHYKHYKQQIEQDLMKKQKESKQMPVPISYYKYLHGGNQNVSQV